SGPSAPETQELSTCSARCAARTNDVDSDEHGRSLTGRGKQLPAGRRSQQPLHNSGRQCKAGTNEGPDQDADRAMADRRVTPFLAWHPALRLTAVRTTPDDPR